MNLFDLTLFFIILLVIFQFWRMRAITEKANQHLQQYCEKHGLQLISVARHKTRIGSYLGKLDWQSCFIFEFSGNGENSYQGTLTMAGQHILQVETPAYRAD
ncbi:DUF3301 domain-containing protein [Paraglaciecola sp. L1A13]|uniref:DUF3301 domain-containing protein n=1 Tax=Paraglaciecola sp. L1A13 TaxID=2686359 RepID=UPI00131ABDEA|nr:DUF3301 domain-containing protein [Paraglaciecola sp. L1A13]